MARPRHLAYLSRLVLCTACFVSPRRIHAISLFDVDDTIVAIASPLAPGLRGIVRLSGASVVETLQRLGLHADHEASPAPSRFSTNIMLGDPLGAVAADVLLWPTNRSYTGQPSAELHLVGSLPILDAVVERLIAVGARAARAGEFTMRSFLAGRLDLTQAEAVLGVIDAEDAGTLTKALSQLAGNLSRPLQIARGELLNLLADVEAGLDFVDEDIEFISDVDLQTRLQAILDLLERTGDQLKERAASQSMLQVVLRGLPNAGKSCLLNALSQTDSAIVTAEAGTTRDSISVICEINGYPVQITDTAGIEQRAATDPDAAVSSKAQRQAAEAAARADLCLWCVDGSAGPPNHPPEPKDAAPLPHRRSMEHWMVLTKSDLMTTSFQSSFQSTAQRLPAQGPVAMSLSPNASISKTLVVSAMSGSKIALLREELAGVAERLDGMEVGNVIGTAARCRGSLIASIEAIGRAMRLTRDHAGHEFIAAEIRQAAAMVGDVTGEVYTDDLLDRVFSRFCIGK